MNPLKLLQTAIKIASILNAATEGEKQRFGSNDEVFLYRILREHIMRMEESSVLSGVWEYAGYRDGIRSAWGVYLSEKDRPENPETREAEELASQDESTAIRRLHFKAPNLNNW